MLSLQTLNTLEALITSRNHPAWGELSVLVQLVNELQQEKNTLNAMRARPATPTLSAVPGPREPPTPADHKEVG